MKIALLAILTFSIAFIGSACQEPTPGAGEDSPTGAYKSLYAAVKSKDTEAIKAVLTKKSIEFGKMASERNKTPLEKVYENGFTATTFSETMPNIRDERIKDDMGAVEVWNSKDSRWEDLPFIKEDGGWKLAVGDMFAGSYQSPGPGACPERKRGCQCGRKHHGADRVNEPEQKRPHPHYKYGAA